MPKKLDTHLRNEQLDKLHKDKQFAVLKIFLLAIILVILFISSFNLGRYDGIDFLDVIKIILSKIFPSIGRTWDANMENVILFIRFPRIFAAVLIGAALSLSGATYQAVFKNPLVSPDILGASAGASLGAAIAIFIGKDHFWVQLFAFAFSLISVALVCLISNRIKKDPSLALILSGIFIGALASAIVSLIKFMADPNDKLPTITYWLLGSLSYISMENILPIILPVVISGTLLLLLSWRINVLALGDNEAKSLGIETKRLRWVVIICSTILTAAAISVGGLIGWVGLVIPHLMRMFIGSNSKFLFPASIFAGGAFLLIVDNVARSLSKQEIPLGVLTAIIGAPFFILLLMKKGG